MTNGTLANDTTSARTPHCLRCGRPLTSARSRVVGYGSECWTAILAAARTSDLSDWSERQVDDALELLRDGAIVLDRVWRNTIYRCASNDGLSYHLTTRHACSCVAGVNGRCCYHRCAVLVLEESR